jgi:hypothetical protein
MLQNQCRCKEFLLRYPDHYGDEPKSLFGYDPRSAIEKWLNNYIAEDNYDLIGDEFDVELSVDGGETYKKWIVSSEPTYECWANMVSK